MPPPDTFKEMFEGLPELDVVKSSDGSSPANEVAMLAPNCLYSAVVPMPNDWSFVLEHGVGVHQGRVEVLLRPPVVGRLAGPEEARNGDGEQDGNHQKDNHQLNERESIVVWPPSCTERSWPLKYMFTPSANLPPNLMRQPPERLLTRIRPPTYSQPRRTPETRAEPSISSTCLEGAHSWRGCTWWGGQRKDGVTEVTAEEIEKGWPKFSVPGWVRSTSSRPTR